MVSYALRVFLSLQRSIEKCRRDLQLKNNVIRQLIVQSRHKIFSLSSFILSNDLISLPKLHFHFTSQYPPPPPPQHHQHHHGTTSTTPITSTIVLPFKLWCCILIGDSFAKTREELENTINQQRRQIEELLKDKEQLHSSLVQSRERITYLEKEVKK